MKYHNLTLIAGNGLTVFPFQCGLISKALQIEALLNMQEFGRQREYILKSHLILKVSLIVKICS